MTIKRYSLEGTKGRGGRVWHEMVERADGEWVMFHHVRDLLRRIAETHDGSGAGLAALEVQSWREQGEEA
jgi:hypothetical protein